MKPFTIAWSLIVATALTAVFLSACTPKTGSDRKDLTRLPSNDPYLYVDRQTGCHYLAASNPYGLTPRMDKENRHICWELK